MDTVFIAALRRFSVLRVSAGALQWTEYDGQKVKAAFPSADGTRCVVLLDPYATEARRFENLFCIDTEARLLWKAPLPDTHDIFLDAQLEPDGLCAWSWSCYRLLLDPADGRILSQVFTK